MFGGSEYTSFLIFGVGEEGRGGRVGERGDGDLQDRTQVDR